ncbi:hypothetical protein KM043_009566 [Ampulex compressa]|nr:hypothetical protein KM043_009566 [Ampulex compressa]
MATFGESKDGNQRVQIRKYEDLRKEHLKSGGGSKSSSSSKARRNAAKRKCGPLVRAKVQNRRERGIWEEKIEECEGAKVFSKDKGGRRKPWRVKKGKKEASGV